MTYTALSSIGPRIAFAISDDLLRWTRLGLAAFAPYHGIDFVHVGNKDETIWISYCPMPTNNVEIQHLGLFNSHHCLAAPVAPWARLKVGAGTSLPS